ncbi:alpha/beta hydrolase [Nocardia sp. NEAU-G5]|uniref:Alpha/beta hydrolase n=1 Tax=Nocardia albiluteola TaxID=2842303 RepID=A0ABS6BG44_9NOCA|nr:alpha/beta hydrolase [Nocardia albiluteola]MBU3068174.1 alpha/beta hydrolase [Nocardia albiluteola]
MRFTLSDLADSRLRPLVEETRAFYDRRGVRRGPNGAEGLAARRAEYSRPAPADPPPVEELVTVGGNSVSLRIHTPVDRAAKGVFLEIHEGGFLFGSAAGSDVRNRRLADALDIAVVSVDYRLAPEHPWPAAPDDCETAALWLAEHAERRFGTTRLAIGGLSSGSTLAMKTLLRLRDRRVTAFDCAVLQYGSYDLSGRTPAGRLIAGEYFLEAYAGSAPDRTDPDFSPLFADLSDLPPILMVIGEADVILEDNLVMAARLVASGADVDVRIYPDAPHGFTVHPTPMGRAALADIDTWLRGHLAPATNSPQPIDSARTVLIGE